MSENILRIKFTRSFSKNGRQWQQGDVAVVPGDLTDRQAAGALRRGQATDITSTPDVVADGPRKTTAGRKIEKTKATRVTKSGPNE